jgi:hypothetical protein
MQTTNKPESNPPEHGSKDEGSQDPEHRFFVTARRLKSDLSVHPHVYQTTIKVHRIKVMLDRQFEPFHDFFSTITGHSCETSANAREAGLEGRPPPHIYRLLKNQLQQHARLCSAKDLVSR